MVSPMKPIVLIPSRLAATRLPNKPLADIHGTPMIVHVWRRAKEAECGPVLVACAEQALVDAVKQAGGEAVLTDPNHQTGSDRIAEALMRFDPKGEYDVVINVQGDLPTIDPAAIRAALLALEEPAVDIGTLVAEIKDEGDRANPNVVKCVVGFPPGRRVARALYFSRATVPARHGPHYHHIGLYAYRRAALERFVKLKPGVLQTRESLEQLRALENGMRIDAVLVDTVPLGVDTAAELARARELLAPR